MGALGLSHDVRTRWDDALAESQRVLDETKTLLRRKDGQRMNRIYWPHTAECLDAFVRAEREHDITTFQRLAECDGGEQREALLRARESKAACNRLRAEVLAGAAPNHARPGQP